MVAPSPRILIGPAGWAYDDWKGVVYPESAGAKFDPLRYLSRFFDLIEVNSTFYRPPSIRTTDSWARRVRDREGFQFTVKAFRGFTHDEEGKCGAEEAKAFLQVLEPLKAEGRLGAILFQFPFWFGDGPENRDRLSRLAEWFGDETPRSVEIRHLSWLRREPMTFLHERGFGFVNIDLPPSRSTPPPTDFATSPVGYVRLHGRNTRTWFSKQAGRDEKYDYRYSREEIDEWIPKIRSVGSKTTVTYVVTNNHFRGQAPANALEIMARIAARRVGVPGPLARAYPDLTGVGDPVETGESLF